MSWGYILDLQVRVESKTFGALKKKKVADIAIAPDWTGFKDEELVEAFTPAVNAKLTFEKWLRRYEKAVMEEAEAGGMTSLRVVATLDRSQLDLAHAFAAMLIAAGEGTLFLVNDGTYSGDDGRELKLVKGKLASAKLKRHEEKLEELFGLLVPAE